MAKSLLRSFSTNQIPKLAFRKRHFRLLVLVEVVEIRIHGFGETGHVTPRMQLQPGVVAGACFAGFEDEKEGIEAGG
jgi:hypothetical protein